MDEMRISEPVPYIVYESERARSERLLTDERARNEALLKNEREHRRKDNLAWLIVCILLVIALIAYVAYDKWQESQYETTTTETIETSTEGGGNAYGAIVDGSGNEVTYGTSEDYANENENP